MLPIISCMPFNKTILTQVSSIGHAFKYQLGSRYQVQAFVVQSGFDQTQEKNKHNKQTLCIGEQTTTNKQTNKEQIEFQKEYKVQGFIKKCHVQNLSKKFEQICNPYNIIQHQGSSLSNLFLHFVFSKQLAFSRQSSFSSNNASTTIKNSSNLSPSTSLQSSHASKGQFLYIMTRLSIFSTPKQHHHKLMSTPTIQKIHLVSIYELKMPIICCAKKVTFGNLNSLATHHINGSRPYAFSMWNSQNKVYPFQIF